MIGAPWAYLLRSSSPARAAAREGTIFYPFHGFEKQLVTGDHRTLADAIRATETGPVTVCLYWLDTADATIRRSYEEPGSGSSATGTGATVRKPGDGEFLDRQLAELRRHRRVASNRLSTALLYGASAGCEHRRVRRPEMTIEDEPAIYGGNARIRRLWPEMHQEFVPADEARAFAAGELGLGHVVSPAELAEICGWTEYAGGARQPALAGKYR